MDGFGIADSANPSGEYVVLQLTLGGGERVPARVGVLRPRTLKCVRYGRRPDFRPILRGWERGGETLALPFTRNFSGSCRLQKKATPTVYSQIFLTNVLRLLDEKNMTKQALAEKAGMSISFLSDLTNGKANPSLKIMAAIASALEVSLPSLLEVSEDVPAVSDGVGSYQVTRRLPPGMSRVAAVLTDYQAFNVRQWDEANRKLIAKSKGRGA
jgi:transcriptional regulator with XRE-family HTH domain